VEHFKDKSERMAAGVVNDRNSKTEIKVDLSKDFKF